jgi:hypothetical protein
MSIALRGNLRDFGISEVFQLIGQQRKTGVLEIAGEEQRIQLRFDAGAIVGAEPVGSHPDAALGDLLMRVGWLTRERLSELVRQRRDHLQALSTLLASEGDLSTGQVEEIEDLLTQESLFAVLRLQEGSFHFLAQAVEHDRPPMKLLGAEQVLMDGMRMVDEWQTFADRVPSEETVFQRIASFEARGRQLSEGPARQAAERLYLMVDGRLSARRLIDLSRLGTFEGTRLLAQLCDLALIEPVATKPAVGQRPRTPALPGSPLRLVLASLLPLLVLASLLGLPGLTAAPEERGAPLVEHAWKARAWDSLSVRRLERAVEAHRLVTGQWPTDLEQLVERGWLPRSTLTGHEGRPYYYARRGGTYVLLAPSP